MNLALFFTRGISLKHWVDSGLFYREKIIYENLILQTNIRKVYWFTYGSNDSEIAENLKKKGLLNTNIKVFCPPKFLNEGKILSLIYSVLVPFIFLKKIKKCKVLMTNQIDGWWSAFISSLLLKKKFILRSGYIQSQLESNLNRVSKTRLKLIYLSERLAIHFADHIIVASNHNKKYLRNLNNKIVEKISIIPNFVDREKFKSNNDIISRIYKDRILYVGRLSSEKNLYSLIKSIKKTGFGLDIYGGGDIKEELYSLKKNINSDVEFFGKIPNNSLPEVYNKYQFYIIPSFFEGMPKTLIEAMSCGCISIGSNVEGISQLINNGENGLLISSFSVDDICQTLNKLKFIDDNKKRKLSARAESDINNNYSLDFVLKKYEHILI